MADQIALLKNIKKVAGLLRISTEKTDFEGKKTDAEETLRNHEVRMKEFFAEWGIELILYKEVLSGGTAYEDRKKLQEALEDLKDSDKNFDALAVIELERLSRDTYVSGIIKKTLEDTGALLISLSPFQILDMNDNGDALMFGFASLIAEHNRKIASNRVKLNKIAMARQGQNSSGSVPLGYKRNPSTKRLEIIEEQATIVKQIFQWYLEGMGQRTICDKLNNLGITNKQGNKWIPNSLRVLLTTETYKGTLIARSYVKRKGKMVENESDTVVIENNHEAIIDPATFERAQELRNGKKKRSGIDKRSTDWNSKKHMSVLDGLVFCSCCHRKSTIKYYTARESFYIIKCTRFDASGKTCNNGGMSIKDIEKLVFERITSYKDEIEMKISKLKSNDFGFRLNELENQKEVYEKSLETLKGEMNFWNNKEMKYEMQKEMNGIVDKDMEQMIADNLKENQEKRMTVIQELQEINERLEKTPNAEEEILKLNSKLEIITELQNREDLSVNQANAMLKEIILKVDYKRITPNNYRSLSKAEREGILPELEVEYIN